MKKDKRITKDQIVCSIIGLLLAMMLIYLDTKGIISLKRIASQVRMVVYIIFVIGITTTGVFLCYLMLLPRVKNVDKKKNHKQNAEAQDEQETPVEKVQSCDTDSDKVKNNTEESVHKITNIDDFRNIQKGQQFTIGGMLYHAMQSYDICKKSVMVCCYKDYPNGGYDFSDTYPLADDDLEHVTGEKSQKEKNIMSLDAQRALHALHGRERLKSYESNEEVIDPPCYKDNIYEIYDSYKHTGYRKSPETPFEKLHGDFPLISEDDLNLLIQYLKEADDYCENVCCEFAMIYDTLGIPKTAEAETDKNRVVKICMTRYPWMKEERITNMLSGICWLCNR